MSDDGQISSQEIFRVARAVKKGPPPSLPKSDWITTFADMVTLLLTFLVLLISVTTLDPRTPLNRPDGDPQEREEIMSGSGILLYSDRGLMAPVIELIENIDQLPESVMFDQSEIKNAVFQLDPSRSAEYEQLQEALDKNVKISRDSRGLVIQWDRSLLFNEGQAEIFDDNLVLLDKLALFLKSISYPVSIEGHTNPLSAAEGGYERETYDLSFKRSKAIMAYLSSLGINERRFRLAGYGGSRPRTFQQETSWENSRLEIVIYKPPQGSPFSR